MVKSNSLRSYGSANLLSLADAVNIGLWNVPAPKSEPNPPEDRPSEAANPRARPSGLLLNRPSIATLESPMPKSSVSIVDDTSPNAIILAIRLAAPAKSKELILALKALIIPCAKDAIAPAAAPAEALTPPATL